MKRLLGQAHFCGEQCNVYITRYGFDQHFGIVLESANDGMPVAKATSWYHGLENREFAIKDYSENEGMLDCLLEANIIEPPHRKVQSGFVELHIVKLKSKQK